MYPATVLPRRTSEIGNIVVPAGDPGEQLIANVILSVVACQLHSDAAARPFIIQAHALALQLASRCLTYRPRRPSKFARLAFEIAGRTEAVLYSVIDDILVVPTITPTAIVRRQPTLQPANLLELEIVRYMLCLRAQKIAALLESLAKGISRDQLSDVAERILTQCLRHALPPAEPLDRASENFTLAHDLIGKRNYPLAALALNGAGNALDVYAKTTSINDHSLIVQSMRSRITLMLDQIKHRAA
jgi:hypothetical protein